MRDASRFEPASVETSLQARAWQQAVLAELSQRALATSDLSTLLDDVVTLVARTLTLEHCAIFELLPEGTALRLRAGVGWRPGVVGHVVVPGGLDSQAGYTLLTGASVIIEDMRSDRRFRSNALLHEHKIVGGISVPIPGGERGFGVLTTHSRAVRPFTDDDVLFLEAVGNLLASAMKRLAAEEQLREKEALYRSIFEATTDGLIIHDLETDLIVEVNPAFCAMHGFTRDEMIGVPPTTFIHADSLSLYPKYLQSVKTTAAFQGQALHVRRDGTPFPVEVHGTAMTYEGKRRGVSLVRDITEQVQAYQLLERRVAERTQELATLLAVSQDVASTLDLQPLLGLILTKLKTVVDYTAASIFVVDDEYARVLDYRGPLPPEQMLDLRIPRAQAVGYQAVLQHDGPIIIEDLQDGSPMAAAFRALPAHLIATFGSARSVLVVPLKVKERLIGVVRLDHGDPRAYAARQASLALAIANQAAMAIENARLYTQAHDTATLEERQRLARELHDSVTQALYGVTLYAEAAASVLAAGDQKTATTYLHEVRDTAQEALQEMRLLIFELRPPILEAQGLSAALQARLNSVEGRTAGLTTHIHLDAEVHLPRHVEAALYRIGLEALNNVLKHANAHTVTLTLCRAEAIVRLEIADDGDGFDPAVAGRGGGVGLHSMRERAALVGAHVSMQSTPGEGTVIRVDVPYE